MGDKKKKKKQGAQSQTLREHVANCLRQYFDKFDGEELPTDIYRMVLEEVEVPLLKEVMRRTGGNKVKAAEVLGLNRATLRKKLDNHNLN